jgi:hypothetical protein
MSVYINNSFSLTILIIVFHDFWKVCICQWMSFPFLQAHCDQLFGTVCRSMQLFVVWTDISRSSRSSILIWIFAIVCFHLIDSWNTSSSLLYAWFAFYKWMSLHVWMAIGRRYTTCKVNVRKNLRKSIVYFKYFNVHQCISRIILI